MAIHTCDCGQKNRVPDTPLAVGKRVICGACKAELFGDADDLDASVGYDYGDEADEEQDREEP